MPDGCGRGKKCSTYVIVKKRVKAGARGKDALIEVTCPVTTCNQASAPDSTFSSSVNKCTSEHGTLMIQSPSKHVRIWKAILHINHSSRTKYETNYKEVVELKFRNYDNNE